MKVNNILLVEDDKSLAFVIEDNLRVAGFQTTHAMNGKIAIELFNNNSYDLCLMDVMIPEMDGFECARQIRKFNSQVPILFLTARSMQEDVINGFESGGDDYILKPFDFNELLMRINVFLKRNSVGSGKIDGIIEITSTTKFHYQNHQLIINGEQRQLTAKEAQLLLYLSQTPNVLLKREEILINVWGDDDYFLGRSLDVFISRLRKYLSDDVNIEIQNHHGVGFVFKTR